MMGTEYQPKGIKDSESVRVIKTKPKYTESSKLDRKPAGFNKSEVEVRKLGNALSSSDKAIPSSFHGPKRADKLMAGKNLATIKREFSSLYNDAKSHFEEIPFEQLSSRVQMLHVVQFSSRACTGKRSARPGVTEWLC